MLVPLSWLFVSRVAVREASVGRKESPRSVVMVRRVVIVEDLGVGLCLGGLRRRM